MGRRLTLLAGGADEHEPIKLCQRVRVERGRILGEFEIDLVRL